MEQLKAWAAETEIAEGPGRNPQGRTLETLSRPAIEQQLEALSLYDSLRREGYPVRIQPQQGEEGQIYRVRIAGFSSEQEANALGARLKEMQSQAGTDRVAAVSCATRASGAFAPAARFGVPSRRAQPRLPRSHPAHACRASIRSSLSPARPAPAPPLCARPSKTSSNASASRGADRGRQFPQVRSRRDAPADRGLRTNRRPGDQPLRSGSQPVRGTRGAVSRVRQRTAAAIRGCTCITKSARRATARKPAHSRPGRTCRRTPTCCSMKACTAAW